MYRLYYSDTGWFTNGIIYDPRAAEYAILDGKLTQKLNTAGTLTFTLPPGREDPFSHTGVLLQDRGETLFSGRILKTETDFEGFTTVTCEGVLGELNGFIVRPYDFSGSDAQADDSAIRYLQLLIQQAGASSYGWLLAKYSESLKKLEYSARSSTLYPTLMDEINQKLLQKQGGYLKAFVDIHYTNAPSRILEYVDAEEYGTLVNQPIELGKNLTDLEITVDATDRINVLVPLGKIGTDGNRLTIQNATVNGAAYGKDYIAADSVNSFYSVSATHQWEDVTDPTNLYNKAVEYLDTVSKAAVTISASAADLSLAGYDVSPIRLGDRVRLISKSHNLDVTMLCTGRTYDLLDPAKDTVKLTSTMSASTITEFMAAAGR